MTRSRLPWQKSMSKSGIDTRSGFRKRSNSNSYSSGSRSVIFSEYATSEPAPEPRPGPTGQAFFQAVVRRDAEVLVDRNAAGRRKRGQLRLAEFQHQVAALGDLQRVRN